MNYNKPIELMEEEECESGEEFESVRSEQLDPNREE